MPIATLIVLTHVRHMTELSKGRGHRRRELQYHLLNYSTTAGAPGRVCRLECGILAKDK